MKTQSSRSYDNSTRQQAAELTRARVVAAACAIIERPAGFSSFTIDSVALEAGVARMTVYLLFKSKLGILEAVYDALSHASGMDDMTEIFNRDDVNEALNAYINAFAKFYEVNRPILRRLRGVAALDPDFEVVMQHRDETRRAGLRYLVKRFTGSSIATPRLNQAVNTLRALLCFEVFEMIAGPSRALTAAAPAVYGLARNVIRDLV